MQRSASTSRISSSSSTAAADEFPILPTYDPTSHAARKEISRIRSAENAVHFIPVLLLASAVILWFFSDPGECRLRSEFRA
ncbi:hypothetical protein LINGRAHAP2_LOCUS3632 [Linum grandiflorum]